MIQNDNCKILRDLKYDSILAFYREMELLEKKKKKQDLHTSWRPKETEDDSEGIWIYRVIVANGLLLRVQFSTRKAVNSKCCTKQKFYLLQVKIWNLKSAKENWVSPVKFSLSFSFASSVRKRTNNSLRQSTQKTVYVIKQTVT